MMVNKKGGVIGAGVLMAAAVHAGLGVEAVRAASLDLNLADTPDILVVFTNVSYDMDTENFSAVGNAFQLDDDGVGDPIQISNGELILEAQIDNDGNLISGIVVIEGEVGSLGFDSGVLLSGPIIDFGFPTGTDNPLEFVFEAASGDAATLFGSGPIGVVMSDTGFDSSVGFGDDFFTTAPTGTADIAPVVPLPAALPAGLVLLSGLGFRSAWQVAKRS